MVYNRFIFYKLDSFLGLPTLPLLFGIIPLTNALFFLHHLYTNFCILYATRNQDSVDKNDEIDAVGIGEDFLIVAECKYSNKKVVSHMSFKNFKAKKLF